MKKGFTLIELLAVILILGIIALIAIPTVNNILKEARMGAFKSGCDNIMKSMEEACQTSLIRNEKPVLLYTFIDKNLNNQLEIKGTLPDDGYVILDNNCAVTDFYLSDNNNTYSKGEDVRKDYMLKAPIEAGKSIFQTMYPSYYSNIKKVNFVSNLNIPNNAIEIKDPSVSENGKIKSWLIPNESNYDLYIGSENNIYGNYNSQFLFAYLNNVESFNFNNFKTNFINDMTFLFRECELVTNLNVNNFEVSNVTTLKGTFFKCNNLAKIDLSNWNTKNVTDMSMLFSSSIDYFSNVESINLNNWNTDKVIDMSNMFYNCHKLKSINLSSFNTSNVTEIYSMFHHCKSLVYLDLSNFDTSKVTNFTNFLVNCNSLKTLKIDNFKVTNVNDFMNMMAACTTLDTIYLNNVNTLNALQQYFPDRSSFTTGVIIVKGDKTGIDTDSLAAKNWIIS